MDSTVKLGWTNSAEATFNNFVILRVMGEIVESKELSNFRLINKMCNVVVTCCVRHRTSQINFTDDNKIITFMKTMETRDPSLPSVYSKFSSYLGNISLPTIRQFVEKFNNEVTEYEFNKYVYNKRFELPPLFRRHPFSALDESIRKDFSQKITTFLSGTECNLEKVLFNSRTNVGISPEDLLTFPAIFSRLRIIDSLKFTNVGQKPIEIATLLAGRAPGLQNMATHLTSFNQVLPTNIFSSHRQAPRLSIECSLLFSSSIPAIQHLIKNGYNNVVCLSFTICSGHFREAQDVLVMIQQMKNFFQLQKESLEILEINIEEYSANFPTEDYRIQFPILARLKEFTLHNVAYHRLDPYVYIGSLTTAQFPVLQKLSVLKISPTNENIFFPNTVLPSVHTLVIKTYRPAEKSLHLLLPNLSHLQFRTMPTFETLKYVLTHLIQIKSLDLGNISYGAPLVNPTGFWNKFTGGARRISKLNFVKLCVGKFAAQTVEIVRGENGFYQKGSLANLEELKELRVTISSPLELEALVFMSRPGKMKSLKKLTISYAKLPIGEHGKIRKHFLIDAAARRKYLRILRVYHKEVNYTKIIAERTVSRGLRTEMANFH